MKSITNLKKQQYSRIFEIKSQTFATNYEGKRSHSICIQTCLIKKYADDYKIILMSYMYHIQSYFYTALLA